MRRSPCFLLAALFPAICLSQAPATPFLDALKAQSSASSALHNSVTINGTAEWRSGSLDENGPATLVARSDGSFDTELTLNISKRQESFGPLSSRTCQRSDKNGKQLGFTGANCYTPMAWFAPSLLSVLMSNSALVISDDGERTDSGSSKHVVTVNNTGTSSRPEVQAILSSMAVSVFYDPATLLPSWLEYSLHADGNDGISIPVQVFFSDYRSVSGVQVPFRIDRYINRTLELTISADSVSIQ